MCSSDLGLDGTGCTFALTNWVVLATDYDLPVDPTPTGGTIVGDEVTFAGSPYWSACTGIETGGNTIDAVCAQDGAVFRLETP